MVYWNPLLYCIRIYVEDLSKHMCRSSVYQPKVQKHVTVGAVFKIDLHDDIFRRVQIHAYFVFLPFAENGSLLRDRFRRYDDARRTVFGDDGQFILARVQPIEHFGGKGDDIAFQNVCQRFAVQMLSLIHISLAK